MIGKTAIETAIAVVQFAPVAGPTEGLQIAQIVRPAPGEGDNVVDGQSGFFPRLAATLTGVAIAIINVFSDGGRKGNARCFFHCSRIQTPAIAAVFLADQTAVKLEQTAGFVGAIAAQKLRFDVAV